MPFNSSYKESLGGGNIAVSTWQEINRQSLLIDSAVEVSPPPSDPDLRFVHAPRRTDGSCVAVPPLLELRDIALDPSEDCCMRDSDTALGHHLDEVAVAQHVGDIPSDAENDDDAIKMAAMGERG